MRIRRSTRRTRCRPIIRPASRRHPERHLARRALHSQPADRLLRLLRRIPATVAAKPQHVARLSDQRRAIKASLLLANLVNACFGGIVGAVDEPVPAQRLIPADTFRTTTTSRTSTTASSPNDRGANGVGSIPHSRSRSSPPTPIRTRSSFRPRSTCICNSTSKFSPSTAHATRTPLRMTGYSSGFL